VIGFFFFIVLPKKIAQDLVELRVRIEQAFQYRLHVFALNRQIHVTSVPNEPRVDKTPLGTRPPEISNR